MGAAIARLLGDPPEALLRDDLARLKEELEFFAGDAIEHANGVAGPR